MRAGASAWARAASRPPSSDWIRQGAYSIGFKLGPPLARCAAGRFRRAGDRAPPAGAGLPDAGGGGRLRRRERRRAAPTDRGPTAGRGSPAWASPCPTISAAGSASSTFRWRPTSAGTSSTSAAALGGRRPASRCSARMTARPQRWPSCSRASDRSLDDFLYVFIGAALGGGVLLGGDYRRGVNANAGDVGLMPTGPSRLATAPRPAGRPEILLTRASVNALIRHLRGCGLQVETPRGAGARCSRPATPWSTSGWTTRPTPWCCRSCRRSGCSTSPAVVARRHPAAAGAGSADRRRWRRALAAASPESREPPRLVRGIVGRDAPAIGAAILPLHLNYSSSRDVLLA